MTKLKENPLNSSIYRIQVKLKTTSEREEGEAMDNTEQTKGSVEADVMQATPQATSQQKPTNEPMQIVSETGTISSATTITGVITSNGHIRLEGEVIGDIHILGDVSITGKLTGAIEGNKIELSGSKTVGDIKARGDVSVGGESSVKGDIKGQTITVDGKVEGNTEAKVGVHMAKTAMIKGAITAPTLSIVSGAEFQGKVNVTK